MASVWVCVCAGTVSTASGVRGAQQKFHSKVHRRGSCQARPGPSNVTQSGDQVPPLCRQVFPCQQRTGSQGDSLHNNCGLYSCLTGNSVGSKGCQSRAFKRDRVVQVPPLIQYRQPGNSLFSVINCPNFQAGPLALILVQKF